MSKMTNRKWLNFAIWLKRVYQKYQTALPQVEECNFENYGDNYVQWIDNLFQYGDDQYAIQTIEYVLAENYHVKQLWKDYITALKNRNMLKAS